MMPYGNGSGAYPGGLPAYGNGIGAMGGGLYPYGAGQCGWGYGPQQAFGYWGGAGLGSLYPGYGYGAGAMGAPGFGAGFGGPLAVLVSPFVAPTAYGWGLGGTRTWGGTYSPQFLTTGLPTDSEIVEMVYDAIDADPLIPFDADINVDSDAGVVTLTGTVPSKQVKHAAGDDAWWLPGVDDVINHLTVESRRPAHLVGAQTAQQWRGRQTSGSHREAAGGETSTEHQEGAQGGRRGAGMTPGSYSSGSGRSE